MDATDGLSPSYDPRILTFSQAQGYEGLPDPLRHGELKRGVDATAPQVTS